MKEEPEKDENELDIEQKLALMADPLNSGNILEKRVTGTGEGFDKSDDDEEDIDFEALLEELTIVLRNRYFYCVYCGCNFESAEDLAKNCPGDEYEDHE